MPTRRQRQIDARAKRIAATASTSTTGAGTVADGSITTAKLGGDITTAGKALLDDASAAAQRTTLGLGALATASSVNLATQVTGSLGIGDVGPTGFPAVLIGRGDGAGAGALEEITLGTNLSMSGTTLNASGGSSGLTHPQVMARTFFGF